MRITLTLDDSLVAILKERAVQEQRSFKETVIDLLRAGLVGKKQPKPFQMPTFSMGGPIPGINLDKALSLAAALEDGKSSAS
jgi:plasmid stability protein